MRRFQESDAAAVSRFNERMEAGGTWHRLYEEDVAANPDADLDLMPVYDSLFVAADGEEVRGGAWLREQYFWVDGERHRVGWIKYPVAESLIDPRYAGVPASIVLQFLRHQPQLMALGLGGHDAPFARLLSGIGWESSTVPFLFRIVRPFRVLRRLAHVRRRPWLRLVMDLAAWSGAGWIAHRVLHATSAPGSRSGSASTTPEARFSPWADATWETCRGSYAALALRDARALDHVYPESSPDLHRLRVTRAGEDVGWVCAHVLPASPHNARYFGDLRVGLLTEVLSAPEDAGRVLAEGVKHLERVGVDLVIGYFSHTVWIEAARRLRFLPGPSNFAFYRSPAANELFVGDADLATRCHFTRYTFGEDVPVPDRPLS